MFLNNETKWNASYDVIVVGFGAAGATAARFAADNGAKVLLTDAAPNGNEGGNSRYAGQVILTGYNYDKMLTYMKRLFGPIKIDDKILETYVQGLCNIPEYLRKYLDVEPVSYNKVHRDPDYKAFANGLSPEYPEFKGSDTVDLSSVHDGYFDSSLWKNVRQHVIDRQDKISVWFSSPARHLIQNPQTKAIVGVQIERGDQKVNIQAKNGVVLTLGGFENNNEYIQNYINVPKLKVIGTLYNNGDGIAMGQEVGAKFWHMGSYEGYGFNTGFTFENPQEQRGKFILGAWPELSHGSIIVTADDGSRYVREDENGRHGHAYEHGSWHNPQVYKHPHLIFDQKQYDKIKAQGKLPYPKFFEITIKADSINELATKISADPEILTKAITKFNEFAKNGNDLEFGRAAASMLPFNDAGPYYAVPLATATLNTQGGPQRNEKAEILDFNDQPIPHLYSAGEFGGINANQYNGGGNLAECLIFGKIAGENAAQEKLDRVEKNGADATTSPSISINLNSDITTSKEYPTEKNQYIGRSNSGIGGEVVVRVTLGNNDRLNKVEMLEQSESSDVGSAAVAELPKKMVEQNSVDVDSVSGASSSSRAIKDAVKNALSQKRN